MFLIASFLSYVHPRCASSVKERERIFLVSALCVVGRMHAIPETLFTRSFRLCKRIFLNGNERERERMRLPSLVFQISPSRNTLQSISVANVFSRVS